MHDVLARLVAGLLDGFQDQLDRLGVGLERRGEAALVADAGASSPCLLQHGLERVVDLGPPAQRLAEVRRADRRDHELLEVRALLVGVGAAVDDVDHRHGQQRAPSAPPR